MEEEALCLPLRFSLIWPPGGSLAAPPGESLAPAARGPLSGMIGERLLPELLLDFLDLLELVFGGLESVSMAWKAASRMKADLRSLRFGL